MAVGISAFEGDNSPIEKTKFYNLRFQKKIVQNANVRLQKDLRISIITVTLNSAATIRDTLHSVKKQSYVDIEHIIIDGGSTDNTLQIIELFPHVSLCISEKDNGIYDAMNKGLQIATGDVIGILNSDDMYAHEEVLANVAARFEKEDVSTLYADLQYVDLHNSNQVLRKWKSGTFKRSRFIYGWMPPHPTFFVKKNVYDNVGLFNSSFKSAADYEIMLRILFRYRYGAVYLPEVIVKMRIGGVSNRSIKRRLKANKEDRQAWDINNLRPLFFTLYLKPLRKVFQFINKNQLKKLAFNFLSC